MPPASDDVKNQQHGTAEGASAGPEQPVSSGPQDIECVECVDGVMEAVLLSHNGVYVPGRECDSCGATVRVVS